MNEAIKSKMLTKKISSIFFANRSQSIKMVNDTMSSYKISSF